MKARRLRQGATRFERILADVATDPELSLSEVGLLVRGLIHAFQFNSIDEMADHYAQFDEHGKTKKGYGRDAYRSAAKGLARKQLLTREMPLIDGIPRLELTFHAEPYGADVRKFPTPDKPSSGVTSEDAGGDVQNPRSPIANVEIAPTPDKPSSDVTCDDAAALLEDRRSEAVDVRFAPTPDKPSFPPYTEGFPDVQTNPSGQPAPADSTVAQPASGEGEDLQDQEIKNEHQQRAEAIIDALPWTQRLPTVAQRAEMVRRLTSILADDVRTFDEMRQHLNGSLVGARSEIGVQMYRLTAEGLPVRGVQVQLPKPRESNEYHGWKQSENPVYGRPTRPSRPRNPTDSNDQPEPI